VTRLRLRLGRDAFVLREDEDQVELESRERLAPGRVVRMFRGEDDNGRLAFVAGWTLVRMGSHGPVYRGCCRWTTTDGNGLPRG
jgi:hypothetical protein